MRLPRIPIIFLIAIVGNYSFGSGVKPCTSFISSDGRSFLIHDAYKASDLIAIGQVTYGTKTTLKIKKKIKGDESANEIELTSAHCHGTACSGGFSVAPKIDMLFFLKRQSIGVYDSVTGNGNFSCPIVYEVDSGSVKFGDKKVSIDSLEKYLQTKSNSVPLY